MIALKLLRPASSNLISNQTLGTLLLLSLFVSAIAIPVAVAALASKIAPYSAQHPGKHTLANWGNKPLPPTISAFAPLKDTVGISWDAEYVYIEGNGLPNHPMMKGITRWQQQVPIPHDFTGKNRFRLPLNPEPLDEPQELTLKGAIAIAVNGIPIFHALTQSGADAYLNGELDEWGGHCGRGDDYHYHIAPRHLEQIVGKGNPVAYGLDGFPIYLENPAKDKPLDKCHGYFDDDGNYRYVGTLKNPYTLGFFRGKVDLDDRPRTVPVRPSKQPLRGETLITSFSGNLADGFTLKYDFQGENYTINYHMTTDGKFHFTYIDPQGHETKEVHERGKGGSGGGKGKGKGEKRKKGKGDKGKGKGDKR